MAKWKTINKYHNLKFINKLRLGQCERIQCNFEIHVFNTRNICLSSLSRMKTGLQRKSVFSEGFKMCNNLPAELKEYQDEDIIDNFNSFITLTTYYRKNFVVKSRKP